jgi:hypothetical protein
MLASAPGPENIKKPILVNVKKREQTIRPDVEHVGQWTEGTIAVVKIKQWSLPAKMACRDVKMPIHIKVK